MTKRKSAEAFGKMIRELREKKEMSLRSLAAKAGLSPTYMSRIERGDAPPPAESKISKIASVLEQDEFEFFAEAGLVPREFLGAVERHPQDMAVLLRHLGRLSPERIRQLAMLAYLGRKEDLAPLIRERADEVAEKLSQARDLRAGELRDTLSRRRMAAAAYAAAAAAAAAAAGAHAATAGANAVEPAAADTDMLKQRRLLAATYAAAAAHAAAASANAVELAAADNVQDDQA